MQSLLIFFHCLITKTAVPFSRRDYTNATVRKFLVWAMIWAPYRKHPAFTCFPASGSAVTTAQSFSIIRAAIPIRTVLDGIFLYIFLRHHSPGRIIPVGDEDMLLLDLLELHAPIPLRAVMGCFENIITAIKVCGDLIKRFIRSVTCH